MSLRSFFGVGAIAAIVAGVTGSASAATFSFASDNNPSAFTFLGTAGSGGVFAITDGGGPRLSLELFVAAPGRPTIPIQTDFDLTATLAFAGDLSFGGGLFLHTYRGQGTFSFFVPGTNDLLLSCTVGNNGAILSVTGALDNWGSGGGFFGSDSTGSVSYQATQFLVNAITNAGQNPANYGIAAGLSTDPDDFSFTLTNINMGAGGPITPGLPSGGNPNGRLPTNPFQSEGSYSGTVVAFIPPPSTAAISAVALGLLARRRRR